VFSELSGLTVYLTQNSISNTFNEISKSLYGVLSKYLPFLFVNLESSFFEVSDSISQLIPGITNSLLPVLASTVLAIIKTFPKILLFTGVTLLSLFYFGCDYEKITGFISAQLSEKKRKIALELKNQFFVTILSTVRAYIILVSITFCELLTGFIIIGIPYATILALLISIIDILPVLGTGTVLIPWSVIMFLNKNNVTGLSILALYVIITIIRQIAEPKIIGGSLGLHPLITLMSMYFGVKLVGISGLFTFPLIIIILKNLNDKKCIRLYNTPELTDTEKSQLTKRKFKSFKQSDHKE
jgi:sporulation integral membrane protein YtvI